MKTNLYQIPPPKKTNVRIKTMIYAIMRLKYKKDNDKFQ